MDRIFTPYRQVELHLGYAPSLYQPVVREKVGYREDKTPSKDMIF